MANWKQENTVITNVGFTMLSKAQVGAGKLEITKIVSRDVVSTPEQNKLLTGDSSSIPYKQEAVLFKGEGGVLDPQTSNADVSQITARFSNEGVDSSHAYPIRQIVVFMKLTDLTDPSEDMGEVPYMIAQTEGEDDYDYIPSFSDNPTAINYDLYILHSGVAQISISVKTAGYVDEDEFNEFKNYVISIVDNLVGENTNGMTFNAWTPVYSDDRVWSKSEETKEVTGTKSAERFNCYEENENIATGAYSSVEGKDNVGLVAACHIEGVNNHSGDDNTYGVHIEGSQNHANYGWFQHVEGVCNQSSGYVTHVEGSKNKVVSEADNNVGAAHIEGQSNTLENGRLQHIEGQSNTVTGGSLNHIEGQSNTVENAVCSHIGGKENSVTNGGESQISGRKNTVTDSNQVIVSGYQNTILHSEKSSVQGSENTIEESRGVIVSGQNNTVTENCFESSVSGYSNSLSLSQHAVVSGKENSNEQSDNTLVSGKNNTLSQSSDTCVSGRNNVVSCSQGTIVSGNKNTVSVVNLDVTYYNSVSGQENTVADSGEVSVSGYSNYVEGTLRSCVSGTNNSLLKDEAVESSFGGKDVNVCGKDNIVAQTENSYITGIANSIDDFKPNNVTGERMTSRNVAVTGERNILKGFFSSVVTGKSNEVTNIHDSFIGGKENTVSSEVPDNGTNCILCGGYKSVIENKGRPMFITGTSNEISADNASVMGSDNIASGYDQTVIGHYNIADTENKYAFIVGGGKRNGDNVVRANIFTVDWNGNCHVPNLFVENIFKEDGSQLNSWNIANGTGDGSLVGNNIKVNKATALYSTAFGNNTEATEAYTFVTGLSSKAKGYSAVALGQECESNANYSLTSGYRCVANGLSSQVFGSENSTDKNSNSSTVLGYKNKAESSFASLTTGQENTNKADTSIMTGKFNTNDNSANAVIGGQNNTVTQSDNSIIFGSENNVTDAESIFCISNKANVTNADHTLIVGSDSNTAKEASSNLIVGVGNRVIGEFEVNAKDNIVSGEQNWVHSSNSLIAGQSNRVSGSRSIVNGFQNIVGFKANKDMVQANYGISCSVTGTSNHCAGLYNTLSGEFLADYCPEHYETTENETLYEGNPPTTIAENCVFFGNYNAMTRELIERNKFTIGNGSAPTKTGRRNIFSVSKSGDVYATGTYNTGNADIAEWFEWKDKNTSLEDRRGLFVTLDEDKIVLADENTKYIHGIVSASPAIVGNSYEDYWSEKYLKDVFGEIIYEEYNDESGKTLKRPVINPDFDSTKGYTPRSKRPEWSYVSCVGRLVVVDDGTCVPNGYCRPKSKGIATASDTGFRVMKRIDDTHILVWTSGAVTLD